jgi:hypothetical protein
LGGHQLATARSVGYAFHLMEKEQMIASEPMRDLTNELVGR